MNDEERARVEAIRARRLDQAASNMPEDIVWLLDLVERQEARIEELATVVGYRLVESGKGRP